MGAFVGEDVLDKIEAVETATGDKPVKPIKVVGCGQIDV